MLGGAELFSSAQMVDTRTFSGEFATFVRSARRVELLPAYFAPDEQESFKQYLRGEPVDSEFNSAWHDILKKARTRGARVERLRAIPDSPTPYLCFEILHGYKHNATHGEQVSFVSHEALIRDAGIGALIDYWVFDDQRLYIMIYDFRGQFIGVLRASDSAGVAYADFYNRIASNGHSLEWALNSYVTQCDSG